MLQAATDTRPVWAPSNTGPSFAKQLQASVLRHCQGCPHLQAGVCNKLREVLDAEEYGTPKPCHANVKPPSP